MKTNVFPPIPPAPLTVVPLTPIAETGSGAVQDKYKIRLNEIIQAINDLFVGDITEGDAVSFVDGTLKTKMLESDTLRAQAAANTKEEFMNSPNLLDELLKAIMDSSAANQTMSTQALNSENLQARLLSILLGPGQLWEALRGAGVASATAV